MYLYLIAWLKHIQHGYLPVRQRTITTPLTMNAYNERLTTNDYRQRLQTTLTC
uniref:Uncharacterized protein n=1 Tax=Myoviridae sp. ctZgq1 TaxID=2826666 RepID=A0A8S5LXX4_9CAUD|nr:MAG TPA: hypothetical protein [Myoviridae sp. ctZgq1]